MNLTVFKKALLLVCAPLGAFLAAFAVLAWTHARFAEAQWWSRTGLMLLGGALLGGVVTLGLMIGYSSAISGRLNIVADNVRRWGVGAALAGEVGGEDEIAELDRSIRTIIGQLNDAHGALRDQSQLLHSILASIGDGVVVADRNGAFLVFNPAAERILGFGPTSIQPQQWTTVYGVFRPDGKTPLPAEEQPLYRAMQGDPCDQVELVVRNAHVPAGVTISVTGRPLRDNEGELHGGVVVFRDVSDAKRNAKKIAELNERLEARVAERTAELAQANRALRHRNQENEMFVYSVSHDLRSPLVNLQGFSRELSVVCDDLRRLFADSRLPESIRNDGKKLIDEGMTEPIHFIQSAVSRLSAIIDALLRLSRAGRVQYRLQAVDLSAAVHRVVEALHATIAERGADIVVGPLPLAYGDPTALEQVFANLIGNAVLYLDSKRGGRVEVGCDRGREPLNDESRHEATYFVRDNGVGIPEAYHAKVFQAFQRLNPEMAQGEGIGLAIVHRIVERHGGKVWMESAAGVGTTFFVRLPIIDGAAAGETTIQLEQEAELCSRNR